MIINTNINVELVTCPDCGETKPITEFPKASVGKGAKNYYKPDHEGVPRKRNRCQACQKLYNARAKAKQREREAEAIERAQETGTKFAYVPLADKAPRSKIPKKEKIGNVRKIEI